MQPVPSATFPSKVIGTRITLETWRRAATLKPPDSPLRGLGGLLDGVSRPQGIQTAMHQNWLAQACCRPRFTQRQDRI